MSASRAGRRRPRSSPLASPSLVLPGVDLNPPEPAPETSAWGLWRPTGWATSQRPEDVLHVAQEARAAQARGEPLSESQVQALHNEGLLRDCYATPAWVWGLSLALAHAEGFDCDPFWNPSAQGPVATPQVRLDGSAPELDGLAADASGNPLHWRGACAVNGPHSEPARWVALAARHGQRNLVVAVVPSDGVGWYRQIGCSADLIVNLGRLNYLAPPGLPPRQASPRGSAALIWSPLVRSRPDLQRPRAIAVEIGSRRPFVAIAQPGLGRLLDCETYAGIDTFDASTGKISS